MRNDVLAGLLVAAAASSPAPVQASPCVLHAWPVASQNDAAPGMHRCTRSAAQQASVRPIAGLASEPKDQTSPRHVAQRWKMGVIVRAGGGACAGIRATLPVPGDWPEQRVKIVGEDISPQVSRVRYGELEEGVRQMEALIPRLGGDETAHALVTFEVAKSDIPAPADPSSLRRPKRPPRQVRNHLEPSPLIESRDPQIKSLAKEITDGRERAWDQVEAIYDWVRANIRYEFDAELKGALAALRQGKGDCEELTSLFVALCRAQGVPARSVWVPGHCYPEFFLEDEQGRGYWLPCQAAGASRQFGAMSESRPILQKGDKFQIPGLRKPQRYAQPTLTAQHASAPPQVEWVQQAVKD